MRIASPAPTSRSSFASSVRRVAKSTARSATAPTDLRSRPATAASPNLKLDSNGSRVETPHRSRYLRSHLRALPRSRGAPRSPPLPSSGRGKSGLLRLSGFLSRVSQDRRKLSFRAGGANSPIRRGSRDRSRRLFAASPPSRQRERRRGRRVAAHQRALDSPPDAWTLATAIALDAELWLTHDHADGFVTAARELHPPVFTLASDASNLP